MQDRAASQEKEVEQQPAQPGWRRHFYERLGAIVAVSLVVIGAGYVAVDDLIDKSDKTFVERMNAATNEADGYVKVVGDGFSEAKERFDAAKKQCAVIDELAPQIGIIASAIGTTTSTSPTTTLPPSEG